MHRRSRVQVIAVAPRLGAGLAMLALLLALAGLKAGHPSHALGPNAADLTGFVAGSGLG